MEFLKFWRFARQLSRVIVIVNRSEAQRTVYFDKKFHSQKNLCILDRVDELIRQGEQFKHGCTTTVAKIDFDGQPMMVKRYNSSRIISGVKQLFKVSRAYNSWFYAHWMMENNILTPTPLAVIEQRLGWFRRRSYYLYQYLELTPLMNTLLSEPVDSPVAQNFQERMVDLFKALLRAKTHHRDFKITNFLVNSNEIYLIDLDHMSYNFFSFFARRALRRDRKRFLKNFKSHPEWYQRFEELLAFV